MPFYEEKVGHPGTALRHGRAAAASGNTRLLVHGCWAPTARRNPEDSVAEKGTDHEQACQAELTNSRKMKAKQHICNKGGKETKGSENL